MRVATRPTRLGGRVPACFFFNDASTSDIYTLSLHDALPIFLIDRDRLRVQRLRFHQAALILIEPGDRKSTRLNSSHSSISYAVFCLKKKTTRSSALTVSHRSSRRS